MPEEILQKSVGIDLDGDKKPDIKVDIKSILIVGGFLISGAMSYSNLKQEIEKLEKKIENIEDKVYKR